MDRALAAGAEVQDDRRQGQMNLLGDLPAGEDLDAQALPDLPEWPEHELLQHEKAVLGLYVSGHPLAQHQQVLRHYCSVQAADLATLAHDAPVVVGGLIKSVRTLITKTGKAAGSKMAVFDLEDLTGSLACVIFPRDYARFQDLLREDQIVFVRGTVDRQREEPQVRVSEVLALADGPRALAKAVVIRLHEAGLSEGLLEGVCQVLKAHPGGVPVYLELVSPTHGRTLIQAGDALRVSLDTDFQRDLRQLLGEEHLVLAANTSGTIAKV
jgi:DNA polymerase-3 subunit alpha